MYLPLRPGYLFWIAWPGLCLPDLPVSGSLGGSSEWNLVHSLLTVVSAVSGLLSLQGWGEPSGSNPGGMIRRRGVGIREMVDKY